MATYEYQDRVHADLQLALDGALPPIRGVLKFFAFMHLPEPLRSTSAKFCDLAVEVANASSNPETTVALRKLLEAKDAAVRSLLP